MPDPAATAGHETRDLNVALVVWCALGLVITMGIFFLATAALYRLFRHTHPSPFAASRIEMQPQMLAPPPRLQENPATDLATFRAAEEAKLNSYGWIDKDAGIIRLPIERAMDLIAQRGLPTRDGPDDKRTSGITAIQMQEQKAAATKP